MLQDIRNETCPASVVYIQKRGRKKFAKRINFNFSIIMFRHQPLVVQVEYRMYRFDFFSALFHTNLLTVDTVTCVWIAHRFRTVWAMHCSRDTWLVPVSALPDLRWAVQDRWARATVS
jgi:hypothetical protein